MRRLQPSGPRSKFQTDNKAHLWNRTMPLHSSTIPSKWHLVPSHMKQIWANIQWYKWRPIQSNWYTLLHRDHHLQHDHRTSKKFILITSQLPRPTHLTTPPSTCLPRSLPQPHISSVCRVLSGRVKTYFSHLHTLIPQPFYSPRILRSIV